MQLRLHQGLRNRPHGRANPRQRKIRNRIGRHRGRQPRTQYGLPPGCRSIERQTQRQGQHHRTFDHGTERTALRRPKGRCHDHHDPHVQRRPDRPRNRGIRLPRKDRGADPSHGRGDTARRQSHRTDGRHPRRRPEALHYICHCGCRCQHRHLFGRRDHRNNDRNPDTRGNAGRRNPGRDGAHLHRRADRR